MYDNINDLIELNLQRIFNTEHKALFRENFVDLNEKSLYDSLRLAEYMEQKGLIKLGPTNRKYCRLTEKGFKISENGGWKTFLETEEKFNLEENKRKSYIENLELEKTKLDIDLAKKMIKEYPKTKWFARIGFIIAIALALKELYILIAQ